MMDRVNFTQMKDGTREEWEFLTEHEIEHNIQGTADRLLESLVDLDKSLSPFQITQLGHSVQSATRAWRDGDRISNLSLPVEIAPNSGRKIESDLPRKLFPPDDRLASTKIQVLRLRTLF